MQDFIGKAIAYQEKYNANSAVVNKMREVINAANSGQLPAGTFLPAQFAYQFTGTEESPDLINNQEYKMPYNTNVAKGLAWEASDCGTFVRSLYLLFSDKDIGDYSNTIWKNIHQYEIPWEQRRAGDVVLYLDPDKAKADPNRRASHVALYAGNNKILHETGSAGGLHESADTYWKSARVGVYRILDDNEYRALIVGGENMAIIDDTGSGEDTTGVIPVSAGGGFWGGGAVSGIPGTSNPDGTSNLGLWGTEVFGMRIAWHNIGFFLLGLIIIVLGIYFMFMGAI